MFPVPVPCFWFSEELRILELCLVTIEMDFRCWEEFWIIVVFSVTIEFWFRFCGGLPYHRVVVPEVGSSVASCCVEHRSANLSSGFLLSLGS